MVLPLLVAALLGAGALSYYVAGDRPPANQPALATLNAGSMDSLRTQFNAASGDTRVILLLSPT
jgi:hypothetical protein